MSELTLESLDRDGALTEALAGVAGDSRASFLRKTVIGGGALLAALAAPRGAEARTNDTAILNYALALEYLQASFYDEALRLRALRGKLRQQARVVGAHERAHVSALQGVLGGDAIKRPFFNFRGTTEDQNAFRKTAVAFEDLGTAAYKDQAPLIESRGVLAAAIAIHSVEARHAAWIRRLAGIVPAAHAFDEPLSKPKTIALVASTRFVAKTRASSAPLFTG